MPFPEYTPTVPVFIRQLAERHADRTAIVLGDRRLTYGDLERESAELARGLLAAGVTKATRVGILMPNGPDWVLAWLAAARIGALVVPFNTFYQARELGWVMRHADVEVLLCVSRFLRHDYLARLEECAPELRGQRHDAPLRLPSLPYLRSVRVWGECDRGWAAEGPEGLRALARANPDLDAAFLRAVEDCVAPADPMIVIYSSGSTAEPKGAIHTHGTAVRHPFNLGALRGVRADDRIYSPMPFFWVGGLAFSLLTALHAGACILCEEVFEPAATLDLLERERATLVSGWPHYAKAMAEHPSFPGRDLSSIRGGNLHAVLPEAVRPADPELRSNSLGMTETFGPHTIANMEEDLPERLRSSFGRSVPGVEHKVVDPVTGEPLAAGQLGELCVRGYSVMQGLYKREREEVFDRDGFYHTGDGGRFDQDGVLFFAGRLGDVIKTGGANVSPREVEVVLEGFPEIKEAYLVGVPHPERGQNVAAAVVLQAGRELSAGVLRERLKREVSAYKVPRHVWFFRSAELPYTDTGKLNKRLLIDRLSERVAAGDVGEG
jgi:acyl-CoA synthetase (AMP-forming)/AMP-acid ligase II